MGRGMRLNTDKLAPEDEPTLTVELVPATCWYTNVRSHVPAEKWNVLRRAVYHCAKYRCGVCGGRDHRHPVAYYEVWH